MHALLRREVVRGRRLRNDLASLALAGLLRARPSAWPLARCGIAQDLVILVAAPERDCLRGTWAHKVTFATGDMSALSFKKTLLLAVLVLVEAYGNEALLVNQIQFRTFTNAKRFEIAIEFTYS